MWRFKRNLEKSILKYLRDCVDADWSGISVVTSFNYNEEILPVIAVRIESAIHRKLEIGNTALYTTTLAILDCYCTGEAQRLDLAEYLIDKLREGFQYYEFSPNPGDPDNPTMVAKGWTYIKLVGDTRIDLGENVDKCDSHRHRISCEIEKN